MKYQIIPVTPFQQNCSLVWCEKTLKGAVIDPGGDVERIQAVIQERGITVEKVLLTHGHIDHAGGADVLAQALEVGIEGPHKADQFWIDGLAHQSQMFGFPVIATFTPGRYLEDGDVIEFGEERLEVLHTPGHTPGHVVFFHRGEKLAFVGDVLFHGSIGRTDFPQSDHPSLLSSITQKLWPLGSDVYFVPGHGPGATFADERRSNPFVADQVLQG
ncbi:beta-lactamase domain protein [Ferrimonas balearica DSM 9799]|uniref:Beta-lactamase domain protein n=1 Tax=Ferrimonas balearica (strain DSM 9799 / CCM 4581 / KCTC 23876 / PAT) TaxID=550540 RepID=E1SML7_FERBD|nr:MBL fold metallo-hydrolase [Ferrimonas balearica]MBY6017134.1 MBL fold metallo-hydrolase [Halomonas denitrificans]ADN75556.1 beta-lactamase domain protein [Ferrimonas balearica DSM 9799]MBW3138453.1 MBL fold metallo-hydrolase [Ferrimonas balearica]MBW3163963.1 MBL fold metallo-hydrolase [Ferrimonas balearica]MBY5979213.1 MBL fold metallo-hydrolase [Ferrimonas balearica]